MDITIFVDSPLAFNWKNSVTIKAGVDYRITDRISLRAGYAYQQAMVPEQTVNPGNPDADQHNIALGFGYRPGKWIVDVFYAMGFFVDRKVENTILRGNYHSINYLSGLSRRVPILRPRRKN